MSWGLKDDPGRGAVAGDRGRTPAARRPAVGELGVERRPWSGRCGRGPRVNSCGSAACSGRVRRGTTTLVGALWPGTEGELLRLGGPQWLGTERNDDPGRGAVAGDRARTPPARRPAVGGYGEERRPRSGRCGRGPRANSYGSAARSGRVRRGMTSLLGALWPGTEGKLLPLSGPQWVRYRRVGVGAGPTQMSGSQTRRSRPKTHFLASRGRLEIKECPMCKRRPVHTCRRAGNWNVSPKSVDVAGGPTQAAMTQTAASPAGGRTETHGARPMNRTAGWGTAALGRSQWKE